MKSNQTGYPAPILPSLKMSPPIVPRRLSGFWRRTAAFLIDMVILGVAGTLLGFFMFDRLARLGSWGRLIGFTIAAVYFAVLESNIGKGQTPGKKALGIEVVNRNGNNISFIRSFFRYLIFGIPFFLNNMILPASLASSTTLSIIAFLVFGLGSALLYLYIFNRQTRQSIHDILTGTYVVRTHPFGPVVAGDVWRLHYVVICVLCVLAVAAGPYLSSLIGQNQTLQNLASVQEGIVETGKVHYAMASVGKSIFYTRGKKREISYVQVKAVLKKSPEDPEKAANEIAAIVLARYPRIGAKNSLSIVLIYGYDIGIAQSWRSYVYSRTAGEWQKILHATTL